LRKLKLKNRGKLYRKNNKRNYINNLAKMKTYL